MYLKTHIITSFLIIKEIKGREKREGKNLKHNLFLFLFTYQIAVYTDRSISRSIISSALRAKTTSHTIRYSRSWFPDRPCTPRNRACARPTLITFRLFSMYDASPHPLCSSRIDDRRALWRFKVVPLERVIVPRARFRIYRQSCARARVYVCDA